MLFPGRGVPGGNLLKDCNLSYPRRRKGAAGEGEKVPHLEDWR